jgi:hypothetical protein
MKTRRILGAIVLCFFVMYLAVSVAQAQGVAQTNTPQEMTAKDEDTNLETVLYLIVGTNGDVAEPKLPVALEGVIKELRISLPFKNYRLAATLINRVKNGGRLSLRWLGGPFATAASSTVTPSFSEFKVREVRLVRNSEAQSMVRMSNFFYAARIPVQTGSAATANAPSGAPIITPVINYEQTGLESDISMREGEPVIVGTLNIGPSGDAIILVASAKRTQK